MEAFFFWLFSGGMLGFALAVILNRNAVASALCFTFTIVFMSGLFVLLSAFFLAAVQIIVTAGAVMVLFLFIIMLLDLTAMEHMPRPKIWMACTLALAIGFLALVAKTLAAMPPGTTDVAAPPDYLQTMAQHVVPTVPGHPELDINQRVWDKHDDTHRIGRLLFTTYVAPFEITSLLILVATIGVIVLCKEDEPPRTSKRESIVREAPPIETEKQAVLRS
jgi:NADH-quinone oxidoreductase subunit J